MEIPKRSADADDDGSSKIEYEEFLRRMAYKILNRDPKYEIFRAVRLRDGRGESSKSSECIVSYSTQESDAAIDSKF